MKRIIKSILMLLSISLLVGCAVSASANEKGRSGEQGGETYRIKAAVNRVSGERIEATVTEDNEDAFGVYHILLSDKTELLGKDGNRITLAGVKAGDVIEAVYNGQVMRSYPPQIVALKITVVEQNKQ